MIESISGVTDLFGMASTANTQPGTRRQPDLAPKLLAARVTAAKRVELAALRELAKV